MKKKIYIKKKTQLEPHGTSLTIYDQNIDKY
jgi:hypothetical protein